MPNQSNTSWVSRFNANVPLALRLVIVLGLALFLAYSLIPRLIVVGTTTSMKLRGKVPDCSWPEVVTLYQRLADFHRRENQALEEISVKQFDEAIGIELLETRRRDFWIKREGNQKGGKELLAYLLVEQDWLLEYSGEDHVHSGDIVIDCGAHIGVFTQKALEQGARMVIAVEPDPVNFECLRRNFAAEIRQRKVLIVQKGVWSSEGKMPFYVSTHNSGMNSIVNREDGAKEVQIPVTTIDHLVGELGRPKIDFIKMDIEGAERNALAGALRTIAECRPRLMLDMYHRPDDIKVLPEIIRQAHADYQMRKGPCLPFSDNFQQISPLAAFFR